MRILYDVDDLTNEAQIKQYLVPLREANPKFRITAFAIPNHLGPVHNLAAKYPWITFAIHGFEHEFAECLAWTPEVAEGLIGAALKMGYAPIFRPPNWQVDADTLKACSKLNVIFAGDGKTQYPPGLSLRLWPSPRPPKVAWAHTHIIDSPGVTFIDSTPEFHPSYIAKIDEFLDFETVAEDLE